jgi:hypothetical protein
LIYNPPNTKFPPPIPGTAELERDLADAICVAEEARAEAEEAAFGVEEAVAEGVEVAVAAAVAVAVGEAREKIRVERAVELEQSKVG